jgi:hypothetical protein
MGRTVTFLEAGGGTMGALEGAGAGLLLDLGTGAGALMLDRVELATGGAAFLVDLGGTLTLD